MTYQPQGPQLMGPGAQEILNNYRPAQLNRAGRDLSFAGGVLGFMAGYWMYNTIKGRKSRTSFQQRLAATVIGTLTGIGSSIMVFLMGCLVQTVVMYPNSGFEAFDRWIYLGSVLVSIVPAVFAGRRMLAAARRNQADPANRAPRQNFASDLIRAREQMRRPAPSNWEPYYSAGTTRTSEAENRYPLG